MVLCGNTRASLVFFLLLCLRVISRMYLHTHPYLGRRPNSISAIRPCVSDWHNLFCFFHKTFISFFFLLLPKKMYHKILNIYKLSDDPNFLLVNIYIYVCVYSVYVGASVFFKNNPFHWRLAYIVQYYFCYILAPNRYVVICVILCVCVCVDFMYIASE